MDRPNMREQIRADSQINAQIFWNLRENHTVQRNTVPIRISFPYQQQGSRDSNKSLLPFLFLSRLPNDQKSPQMISAHRSIPRTPLSRVMW